MNNILTNRRRESAQNALSKFSIFAILVLVCSLPALGVIIDNGQSGTSSTGLWQVSGATDPYGSESLWSRDGGTYTWTASLAPGLYDVQLWWTEWPSRTTAVPIQITHADGVNNTTINQQTNGGQWNSVGQFYFSGNGSVRLSAPNAYPTSYCADAVQFLLVQAGPRPVAVIDSISPSPAPSSQVVTFTGHGTDNGTITASQWSSSIDGVLGSGLTLNVALTDGVHTISFRVQDNDGLWSAPVQQVLVVGAEPDEFIIDNGDTGTSSTGTWQLSGASGYYGDESLWSRDGGTYTWGFTPPVSGTYEVFMWWTEWPSRSTAAPVQIIHAGGTFNTTVNQQVNGGLWNSLGTYTFDGPGSVRISAPNAYPTSYCADAVRFTKVSQTAVTANFEATPVTGDAPLAVTFTDTSTGSVTGWQWDFDNNGSIDSTAQDPVHIYTTPGTYSVRLVASSADASDTETKTNYITVTGSGGAIDLILDNGDTGTSSTGDWQVSGATGFYGTNSLWSRNGATYTWAFNSVPAGTYEVYMWWTEWESRSTAAPIQVTHAAGASNLTVNQQTNGGKWNSLGQFYFDGTASVRLSAPDPQTTSYCADAVRIVSVPADSLILDNGDPGTTSTGTWEPSGAPGAYGTNSLWSRDGATYTWAFNSLPAGNYEVAMWWTQWPSRSTAAPVRITHGSGATDITVNQQINGSQWNTLGQFYFNGSASVRLSAPGAYPTSYCADAVKLTPVSGGQLPVATIVSINPNPANLGDYTTFTGQGTDPSGGTITAYQWTSSIDGPLSTAASFSTTSLSEGLHVINFRVRNDSDVWSTPKTASLEVQNPSSNIERIFCCFGYYASDQRSQLTNYLNSAAEYQGNDVWHYNTASKTYIITYVDTPEGMETAWRTPDSHVLYAGHSNYGLGALFSTIQEVKTQEINDLYYVDDPKIVNVSSDVVHVSVSGMRTGQAYPYWWPIYQDGTSAMMPYTFNDPAGPPAYNYYISYQVPGDPTHYMVDTPRKGSIRRYWDTSVPAWFSPTGAAPNPANSAHQQYFVTNTTQDSPSIDSTGQWTQSKEVTSFFKENYWYSQPGNGENRVRFLFRVTTAGNYNVYAWWPNDSRGTTAATYTVFYQGGSDDVTVNQNSGSGGWYLLGQYPFNVGYYSVAIDNDVASGLVFADAIKVAHPDNPPDVVAADFYASTRVGPAPLVVSFNNTSIGDLTGRFWNFGDGFTNSTRDDVDHTYKNPGLYTVSLTASGPAGSNTITKTGYIWVTGTGSNPFQAEFTASSRVGSPPRSVRFRDRSTGNIASRLWNFGDGTTSTATNPTHVYNNFGNYNVSLTITESGTGQQITINKPNFVNVANSQTIDNVDYPLGHFGNNGKNVVRIRPQDQDVPKDEIRCKRVFFYSCNSGNYYIDPLKHTGSVIFYTLNLSDMTSGQAFFIYLYRYLNGYSDNQIWQALQAKEDIFDYYDFSKRPDEQ